MTSSYPGGLDSFPTHTDNIGEVVAAAHINNVQDAIAAIQGELGVNPSSSLSTVDARIAAVEALGVTYRKVVGTTAVPAGEGGIDGGSSKLRLISNRADPEVQIASPTSSGKVTISTNSADRITVTDSVNVHGSLVTNVSDPSASQDAATKSYVDAAVAGVADRQVQPSDHGLLAWSYDPAMTSASTTLTGGTLYLSAVYVRRAITSTLGWILLGTAGSSLTSSQNWVALYNSTGTLLTSAAADSTFTNANQGKSVTWAASQDLATGKYYVGLLANGTTPPTILRTNGSFTATNNVNLTGASLRFATNGTGLTALPSSITPSSASSGPSLWVALG